MENIGTKNKDWVEKNTMACPKCGFRYEKSEGCNHMICYKCQPPIHFCYLCGTILDPRNPFGHFNNPNSECNQKLYYKKDKSSLHSESSNNESFDSSEAVSNYEQNSYENYTNYAESYYPEAGESKVEDYMENPSISKEKSEEIVYGDNEVFEEMQSGSSSEKTIPINKEIGINKPSEEEKIISISKIKRPPKPYTDINEKRMEYYIKYVKKEPKEKPENKDNS